jgi:small subunit ribosomal protein S5
VGAVEVEEDEEEETPEEIRKAYEDLYGPAFSRLSVKKSSAEDDGFGAAKRAGKDRNPKDNMEEKVVQVRRVTKVVKGGKQLSFRAIVVVGDKQGRVGVGVGKAKEVIIAVQKASYDARRHLISVPMTKQKTFPHR